MQKAIDDSYKPSYFESVGRTSSQSDQSISEEPTQEVLTYAEDARADGPFSLSVRLQNVQSISEEPTQEVLTYVEDVSVDEYLYEVLNKELDVNPELLALPEFEEEDMTYLLTHCEHLTCDHHFQVANKRVGLSIDHPHEPPDSIELCYLGPAWKLAWQGTTASVQPQEDEFMVTRSYFKHKPNKATVVERADHILSKDEMNSHWDEVAAAMQTELQTWADLDCFERKPRREARNIIDVTWVVKWRKETVARDASSSGTEKAVDRMIIRARLCLRGFRDIQARDIESYAGTSQQYSQRLKCSEAVLR